MTGRRELYLQEMGLGPVWRARAVPADAPGLVDTGTMDWAELKAAVAGCTACELH